MQVSTTFRLSMEMSRLTRDGTAEPVSRDQILRRERGQGKNIFPVQLTTSRIGNLNRSIHILAVCVTIHAYKIKKGVVLIVIVYDNNGVIEPYNNDKGL